MSLFGRISFASALFAAVLFSTSVAQPPEGGRGNRGGPGGPGRGGPDGPGRGGPEGPGGFRGGPPPEMLMRMVPVLAALDADKDGTISKAEIENATAALKKLDKNNDGDLTEDEMRPDFAAMGGRGGFGGRGGPGGGRGDGFGGRRGRPGEEGAASDRGERGGRGGRDRDPTAYFTQMFESRDTNKDGKLSADEMPEQMKGRVEQLDTDKDGSVSREEMRAMMSRMQRGRERGGADQGGRPGGERPRRPEAE